MSFRSRCNRGSLADGSIVFKTIEKRRNEAEQNSQDNPNQEEAQPWQIEWIPNREGTR